MNVVPLLSALVSLAGVVVLLRLYAGGGGLVPLLFALQLLDMLVGQALEFYASLGGWSVGGYKVYYLSSPLSAGLLAGAVSYALGWRRLSQALALYTLLVTMALAVRLAGAPVDEALLAERGEGVGGMALPREVRVFSPLLTIPSGLASLALPLHHLAKKKPPAPLARGLMGVIAGNLVFMVAGALLRRGMGQAFLVGELIATLILAASFTAIARVALSQGKPRGAQK